MDRQGPLTLRSFALPAALVALVACQNDLVAYGESVVVVSTDVDVTRFASRVRFDIYDDSGTWLESQDVAAPTAADWPLSFSIVHPSTASAATVLVRARAYPDGAVRDYRGNEAAPVASWSPPVLASGLPALCAAAPDLAFGSPLTLRRGTAVLTATTCKTPNTSGAVAARVTITSAGTYSFGVVRSAPDARLYADAKISLALRKTCTDVASEVACAEPDILPALHLTLSPGTYYLLTGGDGPISADIDLVAIDDAASTTPVPVAPQPRLYAGGADVTPRTEPDPTTTMDRLLKIRLEPGNRGTTELALHGECSGTEADIVAGTTCVDQAGVRLPITTVIPAAPVVRTSPALASWSGQATTPCKSSPRPVSDIGIDEKCIAGGPFIIGDELSTTADDRVPTQPERTRVVAPFWLDRTEFTVARYRLALQTGFTATQGVQMTPAPAAAENTLQTFCAWNGNASSDANDQYPLSCVDWTTARALCRHFGSDLPTEEQWEYAATTSNRPYKTQYPWGNDLPTCDRSAIAQFVSTDTQCQNSGSTDASGHPTSQFVDALPWATGDVTPDAITGLGGNVAEWTLDSADAYDGARWSSTGLRGALGFDDTAPLRVVRGSSWNGEFINATSTVRRSQAPELVASGIGFRCARSEP